MKDRTFYIIIIVISLLGIVSTGLLVKYTLDLSKSVSITSYISNED